MNLKEPAGSTRRSVAQAVQVRNHRLSAEPGMAGSSRCGSSAVTGHMHQHDDGERTGQQPHQHREPGAELTPVDEQQGPHYWSIPDPGANKASARAGSDSIKSPL